MVPEAPQEDTEHGRKAAGEGWYVLNARDACWYDRGERGAVCDFEAGQDWAQVGVNLFVLQPGNPMAMYHWEADQEDYLILHGEAVLIAEGEERPLKQWDFVHCPAEMNHVIVGAGSGPCVVVAVGAREHQDGPGWGGYHVDETAQRYNASSEEETTNAQVAYARFTQREPTRYRDGWLP
jgi:uncharacterized cupin superfamily protein